MVGKLLQYMKIYYGSIFLLFVYLQGSYLLTTRTTMQSNVVCFVALQTKLFPLAAVWSPPGVAASEQLIRACSHTYREQQK